MNAHGGNVRAEAARVLAQVLPPPGQPGRSLSDLLPAARERSCDPPLLQELVYGLCRYYTALSWLLGRRLRKPLEARDRDLELLLLIGLFQLRHTRIPDHAAIGETVAAARCLGKEWATGLLNAVLRRFQREADGLDAELATASLAVRWSHPQWLVEMISRDWPGLEERIFAAGNARPPFCLRINARRTDRQSYRGQLHEIGMNAEPTALSPVGLRLDHACDVFTLPGFSAGLVSVQDEAAQVCAGLFPPLPSGARVLDACAAPGGKTAHLAEIYQGIDLLALDIDARRAARISENLDRLQLNARVMVGDAAAEDWWDGVPFDAILLDAPCSATGVLRRHPDGKWLRKKGDIARLARQQSALLDALWPKLRPGGTLIFATCSILRAENAEVIDAFLSRHTDAHAGILPALLGIACGAGRQLLPTDAGPDGFFYCRLDRALPGTGTP